MKKLFLDVILLALFIAALSFHYLPKNLHEILGVVMTVAVVVHFAINFRRFISLSKKVTPKKLFAIEVNIALLIATAIILFTGVCMSNFLFPDTASPAFRRNMTIHNLHTSAPYIMMILIGMHLGLHWREILQRFLNFFGLEELYQRYKKFFQAAMIILSLIGVASLFLNRFLARISMKHIFATPATDLPAPIFVLLMIGGVTLFALATYLVVEKIFKRR